MRKKYIEFVKTTFLLYPIFLLFIYLIIGLYSCNSRNQSNTAKKICETKDTIVYNDNLYKSFKANDSTDFNVNFDCFNGHVLVYFDIIPKISFKEQLEEFKIILPMAERFFNLDSIKFLSIRINYFSGDLINDICQIPEIKNHIIDCDINSTDVNYKILNDNVLKSKYLTKLLDCLKKYSLEPRSVSIEKCFLTDITQLKNFPNTEIFENNKIIYCDGGIAIWFENLKK